MSTCLSGGLKQELNRKNKLEDLRSQGQVYQNDFNRDDFIQDIVETSSSVNNIEEQQKTVNIAGRVMSKRIMGKAGFIKIQDMSGKIQVYISSNFVKEAEYSEFRSWDIGDIVGITGTVFRTKTNEISVKANSLKLLTKSLKPLPDKFHGLQDQETRFRKRYLDLIVNEESRKTFKLRSRIISSIRHFLDEKGFLEVETPMMQNIPGGANAKPFITHHNAINSDLFLRIAPELYLKRLVIGGFEKVYEINKNFRNEGVSSKHNPEFTMLEFYEAYSNYTNLMSFIEKLFVHIAQDVFSKTEIVYQDITLNLKKPFLRVSIKDLIMHYCDISNEELENADESILKKHNISYISKTLSKGKIYMELFEKFVEKNIIQPTFVTGFPSEMSPLAKSSIENPFFSERFELYINGTEISNGFSELNDPIEQELRFKNQAKLKNAGDQEAMYFDEDYITALKYGLPPTAGAGIGIDRLVMLFTNHTSIRDVILFPALKKKT